MTLSDLMKKCIGITGASCLLLILERQILETRKKHHNANDLKIIYQLKRKPRFSKKVNFANEAFAEFEPLGTGQKIQDFRK